MDFLLRQLQKGRKKNAVLFCGAGFTADCLNLENPEKLGVTSHLLKIMNDELEAQGRQYGFGNIKNAAARFRKEFGSNRLMELLQGKFDIGSVSDSIEGVVKFPWAQIYTTNYDNGIETALKNLGVRHTPLNNLEQPRENYDGVPVVHLHGRAVDWTIGNFEESCILDSSSYRHLSGVKDWMPQLRLDIQHAEIVVFVGFSAADFHLEQVFFDVDDLKSKAVFINRPSAEPDLDIQATQEEFGTPLYIGREGLSNCIGETLKLAPPKEPALASFSRFVPPAPSRNVPPVQDIEDLFLWGDVHDEHVKRDCDVQKSDYHILRKEVSEISDILGIPGNACFLHGDICEGKSLISLGVIHKLSGGRPVFILGHTYTDLLDEISSILSSYEDALFVVENCFTISEARLISAAQMVSGSGGNLLLLARSVSTEGEAGKLKKLRAISTFQETQVGKLSEVEVDDLIALVDQIAGWQRFRVLSHNDRKRFIERDCGSSLPSVLISLLNSKFVKEKYKEEYNKIAGVSEIDQQMVIAALLVANLGFDAPVSFVSDVFADDFGAAVKRVSNQSGGLKLLRVDRGFAKTIPSIGARNLLKAVIDDQVIVNVTIKILESMAEEGQRSDFRKHIFTQLMRYSVLNSTVSKESEVVRFFDHISKISSFRNMPLFWLQWHMAMTDQGKWEKAERYLSSGNIAADALERRNGTSYDRKQLQDRRAKLIAARSAAETRSNPVLFKETKEALDIVDRLFQGEEITHHPYETLLEIVKMVKVRKHDLKEGQSVLVDRKISNLISLANRKLNVVPDGSQRLKAQKTLDLFNDH